MDPGQKFAMLVSFFSMISLGIGLFIGAFFTAQDRSTRTILLIGSLVCAAVSLSLLACDVKAGCSTLFLAHFMFGYWLVLKIEK